MKTLKTHLKEMALFFPVLIMLQSCTVYKSTPVTLGEAVKADTKVKIEKRNGKKLKYFKVVQGNDGKYYGDKEINQIQKINGYNVKNRIHKIVLINEDEIKKIQIKDKTTSTILSLGIPLAIIVIGISGVAQVPTGSAFGN